MRKYRNDVIKGMSVLAIMLASYVSEGAIVYANMTDEVELTCGLFWQGQLVSGDNTVYACMTYMSDCMKRTNDIKFCNKYYNANKADITKGAE
jgi:hypothetical protein